MINPWKNGYDAFYKNKNKNDNPYVINTKEYNEWENGFDYAFQEYFNDDFPDPDVGM